MQLREAHQEQNNPHYGYLPGFTGRQDAVLNRFWRLNPFSELFRIS